MTEIQNPKRRGGGRFEHSNFGLRACFGVRLAAFGFHSAFDIRALSFRS
jgi:hypothetical protein